MGWGGVGWGYQRPDDHALDTTLSTYMFSWGCNMLLRWHYIWVGLGGVGWGGDINVLTTTSLILRCQHINVLSRMQPVPTLTLRWGGVGWGGVGIVTSGRPRNWYYVVNILMFSRGCNMLLRWHYIGLVWGGVGIVTSWRPRTWYYVVNMLMFSRGCNMLLRWHYIWVGLGGVGWGGDINVLTTTSLILRCQHICSLECNLFLR